MNKNLTSISLAALLVLGISSTCIAGPPNISNVIGTLENYTGAPGIIYDGNHNYGIPYTGTPFPDRFSYLGPILTLELSADYGLLYSKVFNDCDSSPGTWEVAQAHASMRCDDDLLISALGLNGQSGTLSVRMTLNGSATTSGGQWTFQFLYQVNGVEAGTGEYNNGNSSLPQTFNNQAFDLSVGFVFGTPFHFDAYLRNIGDESVSEGASRVYHGDFSAAWAGITQVLDASGQPVTNFTVSSESGRNYRNAFPNPLPTKRDFNADFKDDIVMQNTVTGAGRIWQMDGTTRIGSLACAIPSGYRIAAIGDFNRDGKPDLVLQNTSTGAGKIHLLDGVTRIGTANLGSIPSGWQVATAGDFNGDGKPDLVLQNTTSGERTIWFMDGAKKTGTKTIGTIPTEWQMTAAGDFNGDGKPDIVLQNTATRAVRIWYMDGATHASSVAVGSLPTGSQIAAIGDFNGDGKPDLIVQNTGTTAEQRVAQIWIMDGAIRTGSVGLALLPADFQIRD